MHLFRPYQAIRKEQNLNGLKDFFINAIADGQKQYTKQKKAMTLFAMT